MALFAMAALISAFGGIAQPVRAAELEGLRFDDATRVGGKELQLNGLGLRSVFIVKGYVAALYLPERARNAALVLGEKGPKRLQIRPLTKLDANTLVKSVNQGLRDNHSEAQVERLNDRLAQFQGAMSLVGTTRKGDVLNLDFSPESGTVIAINGIPRGRPIPGDDFYQAMLRIFLGDKPMDRELKRGLLGG
jgi:hypothetical protein